RTQQPETDRGAARRFRSPRALRVRAGARPACRRSRADHRRGTLARDDHRFAARRRRVRLRPAFPRPLDGNDRRRDAARSQERAVAPGSGDARADRAVAGARMMAATTTAKRVTVHAPERPHFAALPPLALYVHIPWCVRKCPYCDFNSHEVRGEVPEDRYIDALFSDLEFALPT